MLEQIELWNPDQNKNNFKIWLIVAEIVAISIAVLSLLSFLWEKVGIGNLEINIQIAMISSFVLLIILIANYVINKRW